MKIAVYAIAKNEEQFVKRFVHSAKEADYILIADTGSSDNTIELAKSLGIQVVSICVSPWRFDKARDTALCLLPADIDVCVSLDLDEVLEPGWRQEIERLWKPNTTRMRYGYDWGQGIKFQYEKIHARHGYWWHHPCHEYPRMDPRGQEVYVETEKLLVRHLPDLTKSRAQYMGLLEVAIKEDPQCPRNAFYYARELVFNQRWNEAQGALKRYLELPDAIWPNERSYAMRLLGQCFDNLADEAQAIKWFRLACAEAPNTREPWCSLSLFCHNKGLWLESYSSAQQALLINEREHVYTCDPKVWGSHPHDLASIAAWNLGYREDAIKHCIKAVEMDPFDTRLKQNLTFMQETQNELRMHTTR